MRASNSAKEILYQFIRDNDISLLRYHFKYFFHYYILKYNIQVIPHHLSNQKIEALTIIDKLGISFSYDKNSPKVKQNFTLCHELGHFIMNHEGIFFTESVDNQENILEREANIFSSVILMPDIVLLSKIYYSCDSFKQLRANLEVSKQALYFRLLDLLRSYYPNNNENLRHIIEAYKNGQNAPIILLFHDIKNQIINEFNQYKPCFVNQIKNVIRNTGFVTSQDFPELLNQENWDIFKRNCSNLKIWLVYNKGKSIAYVWDKNKLSDKEARKKAELQLLLI